MLQSTMKVKNVTLSNLHNQAILFASLYSMIYDRGKQTAGIIFKKTASMESVVK